MLEDLVSRYVEYKDLLEIMDDEIQRLSSKLERLRQPRVFDSFEAIEHWRGELNGVTQAREILRQEMDRAEQVLNRARSDLSYMIPYKCWVRVPKLGLVVGNDNGLIVTADINAELPQLGVTKGEE